MIITNWQRIEGGIDNVGDVGVYLIYDDRGECLYIGQASCVSDRLLSHLYGDGRSQSSPVGRFVVKHKPRSDRWPIIIVEPSNVKSVIDARFMRMFGYVTDKSTDVFADAFRMEKHTRDMVETTLINQIVPLFNQTMNNGTRKSPLSDEAREYYFLSDQGLTKMPYTLINGSAHRLPVARTEIAL
jgi:hypothetical protein